MSIQPIGSVLSVPAELVARAPGPKNLIDASRGLGEQAEDLLARVQSRVWQATLELGASKESRERYLRELEAHRDEAVAEQKAQQKEAAARSRAKKAELEEAAIEKSKEKAERVRAAYEASQRRELNKAAPLDILG